MPRSMAERRPAIRKLFGLEGVPPVESDFPYYRTPVKFAKAHPEEVQKLEAEQGVQLQGITLGVLLEGWMEHFDFDQDMILDKSRKTGFKEEMKYAEAWERVWERYACAKKACLG